MSSEFVDHQRSNADSITSVPTVGVGMLGYTFMGKAHTNAYKKAPYMLYPPSAIPRLIAVAGHDEAEVTLREAMRRYGYGKCFSSWRDMLRDPEVQLFDNCGPNFLHAEPCIAAAEAGKHVLCEKPMARSSEEAWRMLQAVNAAGVKHMVGFNYRFVPAIRQAYHMVKTGRLGKIYHFRAVYLQGWATDTDSPMSWRFDREGAGSGALGDLGAHIIDLGRFLVGEPKSVIAMKKTFIAERPLSTSGNMAQVSVDDAFGAVLEFENGTIGTLEASRFCQGRKNYQAIEVNGSKGSLLFNLERLNELEVFEKNNNHVDIQGFTSVLITEPTHPFFGGTGPTATEMYHPYWSSWWPPGHTLGWEDTFVHEIVHLVRAIAHDEDIAPYGATFEDGYRNAVICDAIHLSAEEGRRVNIEY